MLRFYVGSFACAESQVIKAAWQSQARAPALHDLGSRGTGRSACATKVLKFYGENVFTGLGLRAAGGRDVAVLRLYIGVFSRALRFRLSDEVGAG